MMRETPAATVLTAHEDRVSISRRRLHNSLDGTTDDSNNWLISLSDLLSLLLVFLIMFLVITKESKENHAPQPPREERRAPVALRQPSAIAPQKIEERITSRMKSLQLGDDISVLSTNREVIITMREKITFMPGEAVILESFRPVLNSIAEIILTHPDLHIDIVGHTDNVPIHTDVYPSNWELSVARATSVLKYFIQAHDISPSRLSIQGNGDQKPLAPNDTPENRARNRRVEVRLKQSEG